MTFKLEFNTDNAAFDEGPHTESAGILKAVAQKVILGMRAGHIHDTNGNKIGRWELDHEDAYDE